MRQCARLHPGDAVRIRGERWTVLHESVHGDTSILSVRGADRANSGQPARFLLPFEPLEPVRAATAARVVRMAAWRARARAVLGSATPTPDALRCAAGGAFDLYAYQLEPALAITRGLAVRLLIADEVGLGKTVQAGLVVAEVLCRTPEGRALILCPAALIWQWQHELQNRFGLHATVLDAEGVARAVETLGSTANPWAAEPLAIASVDFVKRPEVTRALEGLVWDVLVLDEAHNLATRSDRSTAAHGLARRARTVVALTATPHSGDEAAFGRLCSLGDAHGRFPLAMFRRTRSDAGEPSRRRTRWLRIRPVPAEVAMHAALDDYARRVWHETAADAGGRLAIVVLLKRAASSAGSLARSLDRRLSLLGTIPAEMTTQMSLPFTATWEDEEPRAALAVPALSNADEERWHLRRLLALAQAAAGRESKLAALTRWLRRVEEPVLVFTEYRDTLEQLRHAAIAGGVPRDRIAELHGGLTRRERRDAERAFTTGPATLLLATDAASEGLNLQERCRCIINLECPWTPVRLEQRIGRVDRIGQRRPVHAIQMVAAGAFETGVVERMRNRSARAAAALVPPATDLAVVDAMVSGLGLPDIPVMPSPLAVRHFDLRSAAAAEVSRIALSRTLIACASDEQRRAVVTVVRTPGRRRASIWVFELTITDAIGTPVWSTVVGIEGELVPTVTRGGACDLTHAAVSGLREQVARVTRELVGRTAHGLQPLLTLTADREQAIAASVRLRHARIAAELVQPGLFGRHRERRASAQAHVLEEALARCSARLDALSRFAQVDAAEPTLRFALLRV